MWQFDELRRTLQALAQPADVQLGLFPGFVCIGDELVMEFGEACDRIGETGTPLSGVQSRALDALRSKVDDLSATQPEDFWWDAEHIRSNPAWGDLRALAEVALAAFAWPNEPPPKNGATYVGNGVVVKNI